MLSLISRGALFFLTKVVITGLYNRLEIWDEGSWKEYKSQTEEDSGDIAEQLGGLAV